MSGEGAGGGRPGGRARGVGWGQGGGRGCTNTSRLPGDAARALRGKNTPENSGPIIGAGGLKRRRRQRRAFPDDIYIPRR